MGFLIGLIIFVILIAIFSPYMKSDGQLSRGYYASMDYYDEDDDFDTYESHEEESHDNSDSGMFYGGIPMGDSTLYLTDDDDICAEFADEF